MRMDDETLMAFADGELTGAEADEVARAVAADPALAARVDLFRKTRAALAEPAPAPSEADAALIAQIRAAAAAATVAQVATHKAGLNTAPTPAPAANRNWAPTAVAASLVMALGLGWWSGLLDGGSAAGGLSPAVVAALDSVPSAQTRDSFTAIASFQTADGTLCREYETTEPPQIAVACRQEGAWVQRFAATLEAADGYVPASGTVEAVEALLGDLGAGEPLTPEAEAEALARLR